MADLAYVENQESVTRTLISYNPIVLLTYFMISYHAYKVSLLVISRKKS